MKVNNSYVFICDGGILVTKEKESVFLPCSEENYGECLLFLYNNSELLK